MKDITQHSRTGFSSSSTNKKGSNKMTHKENRERWMSIVDECIKSGLPRTVWTRENGIDYQNLGLWIKKFQSEGLLHVEQVAKWTKDDIKECPNPTLKVAVGNTVVIFSKLDFDPQFLAETIRVLENKAAM